MLGKVIKYEWKSTCKVGGGMLLGVFALGIISMLVVYLGFGPAISGDESMVAGLSAMVAVFGMIAFIMLMSGMLYGMYIYLGVRFHKSMYGKEGYLTQTLPVTSHQLLISKVLISGLWISLLTLIFTISIFAIIFAFAQVIDPDIAWGEFFATFSDVYPGLNAEFKAEAGISLTTYFVIMLITGIVTPYALIAGIFGSITMGQLFRKHKGVMGMLCCFLYFVVYYILSFVAAMPTAFAGAVSGVASFNFLQAYSSVIVLLVLGVVMYFVAHYVNTKKLNME